MYTFTLLPEFINISLPLSSFLPSGAVINSIEPPRSPRTFEDPGASRIRPAAPWEASPVEMSTSPLAPLDPSLECVCPEVNVTRPDATSLLEVLIVVSPEGPLVLAPEVSMMDPPRPERDCPPFSCTVPPRSLPSNPFASPPCKIIPPPVSPSPPYMATTPPSLPIPHDVPADIAMSPPLEESPSPTNKWILPPSPPVALPDSKRIDPELPFTLSPD